MGKMPARSLVPIVLVAIALIMGALTGCISGASDSHASKAGSSAPAPTVNVSSLKGPTSIGIAGFRDKAASGAFVEEATYDFTVSGTVDEVLPAVIKGDCDIALVPANAAAVLYAKTKREVTVIDVNTLGVLYAVTGDSSVTSLADLSGRTVYMTGKGTTPEYVMQYLLEQNGLSDSVTLDFKSEATEVAAVLAANPSAIGVLPEPYVTAVCTQNPALSAPVSLTDEWDAVQGDSGSRLVTGVTIVRNEFLAEHPDIVAAFIAHQRESAAFADDDPATVAKLVVDQGIIEKEAVAAKAIPRCNLVCLTGDEMKMALSGYLSVLYQSDPASVGGALPDDGFYAA